MCRERRHKARCHCAVQTVLRSCCDLAHPAGQLETREERPPGTRDKGFSGNFLDPSSLPGFTISWVDRAMSYVQIDYGVVYSIYT